MKQLEMSELRELQMQIMDYVDIFCKTNNINYTLSGGTLLGAVRHGGYIPWDDDFDIQMLRSEYSKFTRIWNLQKGNHPFELVNIESGNNMGYPIGKVHNLNTKTAIGNFSRTGVFIDIFPVDGVLDEYDFNLRHSEIKQLYVLRARSLNYLLSKVNKMSLFKRIKAFVRKPSQSFESFSYTIDTIAKKHSNEECPLVFEMISGMRCKEPMDKKIFETYAPIKFENRTYMAVSDYDTYLRKTFGDYMKLPPVEKRVAHHSFNAYKI